MNVAVLQMSSSWDAEASQASRRSVERMAEWLGWNVEFIRSEADHGRGAHLNGLDAAREVFCRFQELGAYDWILKMDSDVLWLNAAHAVRLAGPWHLIGEVMELQPGGEGPVYHAVRGHAYWLRPSAVANVPTDRAEFERLALAACEWAGQGSLARGGDPAAAYPEDEVTSSIICYAWDESAMLELETRRECGFLGFWPFAAYDDGAKVDPAVIHEMSARFDFVEFGRLAGYRPEIADKVAQRTMFTAAAMSRAMDVLEG